MKIESQSKQGMSPLSPKLLRSLNQLDQDLSEAMQQADGDLSSAQLMEIQQLSQNRALAYDLVQQTQTRYEDAAMVAVRNLRA